MSTYSRVKSWSSNETLTSTDLNAEFNNIITNTNSGNLNSDNVSTSAAWTWTGTHIMSTSSKLALIDNIYLTLGSATDGDYFLRYSASNTALELSTTNADGSGTNAVVVDIQDGTDDVRVRGGLSTDNNTAPTTGIKVGGNVLSDTDSTDDLGTTSVRWANVYTDAVGDSGQTLGVKATTLSFDAASTIDTSGNNALTLDAGSAVLTLDGGTLESDATTLSFDSAATIDTSGNNALSLDAGSAVLTLDGGTLESDASTFSFDAAATIDTSGNNNLTLSAGTGTLVATAGDMTLFDDNNNADVSLSLGTSATEALVVQALNGGSNKTLEELRITTKTASGTAQHGKISFHIDEVNIGNINDDGITLESGKVLTGNVTGNASGTAATVTGGTQAAITTCANLTTVGTVTTGTWSGVIDGSATMTLGSDATGDIYFRDASGFLERLASGADGYVLTGTGAGSIPAWEAVSAGVSLSGSTPHTVATVTGANALEGEANLTFDGSTLNVVGNAGVGIARTDGTLHVHTATAGSVAPNANEDDLVVENSGNCGITILAPDANDSTLCFGSTSDAVGAVLRWNHDANLLKLSTANAGDKLTFSTAADVLAMTIDASQNVGIGTAAPIQPLHVATSSGANVLFQLNADAGENTYAARRSRGSAGSPTAIQANDTILALGAEGYDGSTYAGRAQLKILAAENWSGTRRGTKFAFYGASQNQGGLDSAPWVLITNGSMGVGVNSAYTGGSVEPDAAPPTGSTNCKVLKMDGGGNIDAALQISGYSDDHGVDIWTDVSTGDVYFDQRGDHNDYDFRFRTKTTGTPVDAVTITGAGTLSKASGSFKIDHPLEAKTNTHYLVHSFIEGPQADLLYRGTATLSSGTATVNIDTAARITDGTFVALNGNVQAFTTNESGFDAVRGSVSGNVLTITSSDSSSTATISWLVVGERKDAHMLSAGTRWTNADGRVITEPSKDADADRMTPARQASGLNAEDWAARQAAEAAEAEAESA